MFANYETTLKRVLISRIKRFKGVSIAVLTLIVCSLLSACYDFNNPVDPGADNYQGFKTERDDTIYSISYDPNGADNGGDLPVDAALYAPGDSATVLGNIGATPLALTGNTFVGWNTAADGSGTHYNPNNRLSMPASDVTLYAVWTTSTTYTVNYNATLADGGSAPIDPHSYLPGTVATVLGNSGGLFKNGYRLYSWDTQTDRLGTDYWGGSEITISGDVNLYDDWIPDFAGGDGLSLATAYQIEDANHLYNVRYVASFPGNYFKLTADIDLSSVDSDLTVATYDPILGWDPIGDNSAPFNGNFDGNGFVISNLFIDRGGNDIGLFGMTQGATLERVVLQDVDVSGGGQNIGGLIGRIDSIGIDTVRECFTSGQVNGGDQIGGLVGRLSLNGSIERSYSFADVAGVNQVGGLIGYNGDSVLNSYAIGFVSGTDSVGGLVGNNGGSIDFSYAAGGVTGSSLTGGLVGTNGGTVTDSYYDSDTSGQSDNLGKGDPYITADMTDYLTYGSWDFATVWEIDDGVSYPYLQWQGGGMIPTPSSGNTISYFANGADSGLPPADAGTYLPGASITILGNSGGLSRTGFEFAGWNTAADGSGAPYPVGSASMPASDLNLYAQWEVPILAAQWDFQTGSELIDSSSYGNNLSLSSGSPAFGNDGATDYLEFTSDNDRLSIVGTTSLESVAGGQSFSFWYYGNIFEQGSVMSRFSGSQRVWTVGPQLAGQFNIMDSAGYIGGSAFNFGTGFNPGAWNHVVVTYDVIVEEAQVYINNAAPVTRSIDSTYFYDTGTTFYVGNSADGTNAGNAVYDLVTANQRVAQFRIFNYVLDASEVDAIYTSF